MQLDLEAIAAQLHSARHRDSEMSDWARKWGRKLLEEIRELREENETLNRVVGMIDRKI